MRAELIELKKRSVILTSIAAPKNRNLPPRDFWADLPADLQDQLTRAGISQDEFKGMLKTCGLSDEEFAQAAFVLDYQEKDDDLVVGKLRKLFMAKLPPSPDAIENFK